MSMLIAYLLIGMTIGLGLLLDRWGRIDFDTDSITCWIMIAVVLLVVIATWPTFITQANMEGDDHA